MAQLQQKLEGVCRIASLGVREPEAEFSASETLSKAGSRGQSKFFASQGMERAPKQHKKRNTNASDVQKKKFMKENLKNTVKDFAYDW